MAKALVFGVLLAALMISASATVGSSNVALVRADDGGSSSDSGSGGDSSSEGSSDSNSGGSSSDSGSNSNDKGSNDNDNNDNKSALMTVQSHRVKIQVNV